MEFAAELMKRWRRGNEIYPAAKRMKRWQREWMEFTQLPIE